MPVKLARSALASLPGEVAAPSYPLADVEPGIVHLGLGNFHRAHMARYTHALMERDPAARAWGIVGAGLRASDRALRDALSGQDMLYTLIERDASGERLAVIGSLCAMLVSDRDCGPLLAAMDRAAIVSLTVTEHGYCLDPATKRLDPAHPAIAADLAVPRRPHSAIGLIVEAFRRRREAGRPAFTALSCDNIQHNGHVLGGAVRDFADRIDPVLAAWIGEEAHFPCTMVDRITPMTDLPDVAALATRHGIADACPVFCEPFSQWVIEDDFAAARPAWERVGAQFVDDVAPYEFMKLRLLNASHLAIAAPGRLIGYRLIDEAMRDDHLRRYMAALMDRETGPTLQPVPGVDIAAYKAQLIERFSNPTIRDTVERVNNDAPLNYLLDPIRDRLAAGQGIALLAFAVAAWLRRMRGEDEAGRSIDVRHPLATLLRERAMAGGADPLPMLRIAPLFGDLAENDGFVQPVARWLSALYADGAKATLCAAANELGF